MSAESVTGHDVMQEMAQILGYKKICNLCAQSSSLPDGEVTGEESWSIALIRKQTHRDWELSLGRLWMHVGK